MIKSRRLPNGKITTSMNYYVRSWKKVARPVVKKTGWTLMSFDSQLVFCNQVGQVITLPTWAIQDLFNI